MISAAVIQRNPPAVVLKGASTPGAKGDPGANVMAIGLFAAAAALSIPGGTDLVQTSGYSSAGSGHALYVADAAVDAAYVTAHPRSSFISANARGFRLSTGQILHAEMLGVVVNDSSSGAKSTNATVLQAWHDYLLATGTPHDTYYVATPLVLWPVGWIYVGTGAWRYFSVKCTLNWVGGGHSFRGPNTRFSFADGGFCIEAPDTYRGSVISATTSGGGSCFAGIGMESRAARPSAGSYAATATAGILAYAQVFTDRCTTEQFTLDGVTLMGADMSESTLIAHGGTHTNVNGSVIRDHRSWFNGRHGLGIFGADGNVISTENFDGYFNNNWSIYDSAFLSNRHSKPQSGGNGVPNVTATKHDGLTSTVVYPATSGTLYCVAPGQAGPASTTQPGTNAAVWVALRQGAGTLTPTTQAPLWVSGTSYKEGGSWLYDGIGGTKFEVPYSEYGEGLPYMGTSGSLDGGDWERHPLSSGTDENASSSGKQFSGNVAVTGTLRLSGFGVIHQVGPVSGTGADVATAFNTVGTGGHMQQFNRYNSAGVFQEEIGYIWGVNGGQLFVNGRVNVDMRINGTTVGVWGSSGLTYQADKGISGSNSAAPTTGAHTVGEMVFNSAPTAGGKVGWVCVTGGSPGTWKAFGPIDA